MSLQELLEIAAADRQKTIWELIKDNLFHERFTRGQAYVDQGEAQFEQRHQQRVLASLKRKAATLGMQLVPTTQPTHVS